MLASFMQSGVPCEKYIKDNKSIFLADQIGQVHFLPKPIANSKV